MQRSVLIIDDNDEIASLVRLHLEDIDCCADTARTGEDGIRRFNQAHYDLVILDLMLPGIDGLAVCATLRSRTSYVPILMLTARSSELDRVAGLEIGADDYVSKPFSVPELLARVRALLRRVEGMTKLSADSAANEIIERRELRIDVGKRLVLRAGKELPLTGREFDLLLYFARHPGWVFTRAQLLSDVWGYSHSGYEHTVNSHINRLRAKIEHDPSNPRFIATVWGVGYKFADASPAA